jgi:hypothetical protein
VTPRMTCAAASRMSSRVISAPYRTVGRGIIRGRREESRVFGKKSCPIWSLAVCLMQITKAPNKRRSHNGREI